MKLKIHRHRRVYFPTRRLPGIRNCYTHIEFQDWTDHMSFSIDKQLCTSWETMTGNIVLWRNIRLWIVVLDVKQYLTPHNRPADHLPKKGLDANFVPNGRRQLSDKRNEQKIKKKLKVTPQGVSYIKIEVTLCQDATQTYFLAFEAEILPLPFLQRVKTDSLAFPMGVGKVTCTDFALMYLIIMRKILN